MKVIPSWRMPRHIRMVPLVYLCFTFDRIPLTNGSFHVSHSMTPYKFSRTAPNHNILQPTSTPSSASSPTQLNLFWFGRKDKTEQRDDVRSSKSKKKRRNDSSNSNTSSTSNPSSMGGTVTTLENFKQSQELSQKTFSLLSELSSTNVEGQSAKGNVKVSYDGRQVPISVEVNPEFIESLKTKVGGVEDLNEAILIAMQKSHEKSKALMEEKMQSLYSDLGLPPTEKE